ncbi:MAG TPA: class I lanthipeptide [Pyrinomonadaceae bacterium]
MVAKNKNREEKTTKRRVKVGKLELKRETIKDLTPDKQKKVKGGVWACQRKSADIT